MIYIEKRIHHAWIEWKNLPTEEHARFSAEFGRSLDPFVGKYQHILSNEKGHEISIVELPNYFRDDVTLWEIYCLKGNLFEDIERFGTLDEAIEAAKKYLK